MSISNVQALSQSHHGMDVKIESSMNENDQKSQNHSSTNQNTNHNNNNPFILTYSAYSTPPHPISHSSLLSPPHLNPPVWLNLPPPTPLNPKQIKSGSLKSNHQDVTQFEKSNSECSSFNICLLGGSDCQQRISFLNLLEFGHVPKVSPVLFAPLNRMRLRVKQDPRKDSKNILFDIEDISSIAKMNQVKLLTTILAKTNLLVILFNKHHFHSEIENSFTLCHRLVPVPLNKIMRIDLEFFTSSVKSNSPSSSLKKELLENRTTAVNDVIIPHPFPAAIVAPSSNDPSHHNAKNEGHKHAKSHKITEKPRINIQELKSELTITLDCKISKKQQQQQQCLVLRAFVNHALSSPFTQ